MDLNDYLIVIRRRWVLIVALVLACLAGSAVATKLQTPMYTTSVSILVTGTTPHTTAIDELSLRQLATQRAVAFSQLASTPPAVNAAIKAADSQAGPFSSSGGPQVSASANGNDPFLTVTVTDRDPRRAAAVANAMPTVLPDVVSQLEKTPSVVDETLEVLSPAGVPSSPSSPKPKRNLLIGLVVGLVLGFSAAFVREALDRRLRDSDEVERAAGVTTLGVVPTELPGIRLPVQTHPLSTRAEAYRKVRTNLTFTSGGGVPQSLLITSSISGEGKTTLAMNLALACARTGQSVVLIDADLRRPMVAENMQLDAPKGLTSILSGQATPDQSTVSYEPGEIDVIASGPIPANPSELLGSQRMVDLLQELQDRYDVVVIDAPPVLPVADALVLAVHVDAVVLVAKVGDTTRDRLRRAKDSLLKVNANLVGVVPNAVVQSEDSAYAYAYRYRSRGNPDTLELYTKQARRPEVEVPAEDLEPAVTTRPTGRRPSRNGSKPRKPTSARDDIDDSLDYFSSETPRK